MEITTKPITKNRKLRVCEDTDLGEVLEVCEDTDLGEDTNGLKVCEDIDGLKVCEDTDLGRFKNISAISISKKPIAKKISGQKCVKLCKMFCKVVVNRFEFFCKNIQQISISAHHRISISD